MSHLPQIQEQGPGNRRAHGERSLHSSANVNMTSKRGPLQVSNRIRAMREVRGMTLESLAQRVGATNQQISHLEVGRRRLTVDWLRRLGEALGCHPWLLVSDNIPDPLRAPEIRLLEAFRDLGSAQRDALVLLATSMGGPKSRSGKRGQIK